MVPADVAILEFLSNCRDLQGDFAIQTPTSISENVYYSNDHVGSRCRTLVDRGLVEKTARGKYRLTKRGEAVVNRTVDPSELQD